MKTILLLILVAVCNAQTYLYSNYATSGSLYSYGSYNCYYLSGSYGNVLNLDITVTSNPSNTNSPLAVYISTSSNSCPTSYSYNTAVTTFADKNRLRYSYVINSYNYQYIAVYSTSYNTISYTIKPTLYYSTAIDLNNGTALGQASNSYYTYYAVTVDAQSSPTTFNLEYSGDYVYFYIKQSSYPSSSYYDNVLYSSSNSYPTNYTITTYNTGTLYYYVAVLSYYSGSYGNYHLKVYKPKSSQSDCSSVVSISAGNTYYAQYISGLNTNYYSYYVYAGQVVSINVYDSYYTSGNTYGFTVSSDYGSCPLSSYSYTMESTYNRQIMTFVAKNDGYYILAVYNKLSYATYITMIINTGFDVQLVDSNRVVSYLDSSKMTNFQYTSYNTEALMISTDHKVQFYRSTTYTPSTSDYVGSGYSDNVICSKGYNTYYWGLTSSVSEPVTVTFYQSYAYDCNSNTHHHASNGLGLGLGLGFGCVFLMCLCCACAARRRRHAQMRHRNMQDKEVHIELSSKQPVPMVPLEQFTPAPATTVAPQQQTTGPSFIPVYAQPPVGYYPPMNAPAPYMYMNQPMYVPMVNGTNPFIQQQQPQQ